MPAKLLLLAIAFLATKTARSDENDFRMLWFLLQEAGGVQQQEQWSINCVSSVCQMTRSFSGKDIGSREIPPGRAHELLKAATLLPTAQKSASGTGFPVEEIRVSQSQKSWAKYRPHVTESGDLRITFAWTNFELDLRHTWDGRSR